jgi:hypothetical protein
MVVAHQMAKVAVLTSVAVLAHGTGAAPTWWSVRALGLLDAPLPLQLLCFCPGCCDQFYGAVDCSVQLPDCLLFRWCDTW